MPTKQDLCKAAYAGDVATLRQLALEGADFNEVDDFGDSLLKEVVANLSASDAPFRYEVVRTLLELGANSNILGAAGLGPLTDAMLSMDTDLLHILLEAGADPNKPCGFTESDSFYDWAESDYRYNIYGDYWILPEEPTEEDEASEEAWLAFLDRIAIKHEVLRPDHLKLLRTYGALTMGELETRNQTEKPA